MKASCPCPDRSIRANLKEAMSGLSSLNACLIKGVGEYPAQLRASQMLDAIGDIQLLLMDIEVGLDHEAAADVIGDEYMAKRHDCDF